MGLLLTITGLTGLFTAVYGIHTAVNMGNPYWYTYFVIGSFLFLDQTDLLLNKESNLFLLVRGKWRPFFLTYICYVGFSLLIDLLMGRYLSNMWIYPHFSRSDEIIHVILIGYPFALFSVSALYRNILGVLKKTVFPPDQTLSTKNSSKQTIGKILLIFTIISILIPVINFIFFGNREANKVIVICMILGIFTLSPVTLLFFPRSFLGDLLSYDRRTAVALIATSIASGFIHEVPNTYAWEWQYQNIPFTSLEILGVNIIVLGFGWLYLTILGVSINDLFFQMDK